MVKEESIQKALDFIKNSRRKVASSELVSYMESKDVTYGLQTTEMITRYKIIPELKKRGVIKIARWRPGKKQLLSFNHKNKFDAIVAKISQINEEFPKLPDPTLIKSVSEAIKSYDEKWVPSIKIFETWLKLLLSETDTKIHDTATAELLNKEIAKTWRKLSLKDGEVERKIGLLKQYVKSKKQ